MALSAPTRPVWIIAIILGVLGLLGKFVAIPFVTAYAFWLAAGSVVLAIGTALKESSLERNRSPDAPSRLLAQGRPLRLLRQLRAARLARGGAPRLAPAPRR